LCRESRRQQGRERDDQQERPSTGLLIRPSPCVRARELPRPPGRWSATRESWRRTWLTGIQPGETRGNLQASTPLNKGVGGDGKGSPPFQRY
jgi:hypothetical protein